MADSSIQLEVEAWVRKNWMSQHLGERFHPASLKLSSGGVFDFDAVNDSKCIAACISTSDAKTSGGKGGSGKLHKLRADMLFLHLAEGLTRKLMIFTERGMFDLCEKERKNGRTPSDVEFLLASIPSDLHTKLIGARHKASREVTPVIIEEQMPDEVLLDPKTTSSNTN